MGEYFTSGLFCLQSKHLTCECFLRWKHYMYKIFEMLFILTQATAQLTSLHVNDLGIIHSLKPIVESNL